MSNPPRLYVMSRCCQECLFGSRKLVDNARKKQILTSVKQVESHFICHEGSTKGKNVCCRAFYDTQDTMELRMARLWGLVQFVTPEEIPDLPDMEKRE